MVVPVSRSSSKQVKRHLGFAVAALAGVGCVTRPVSDTMATTNVMTFEGYYPHTSAGSVSIYGVEPSNQSLSWLADAAISDENGFLATVDVPARFWPGLCVPAAFRIFPSGGGQSIPGYDLSCLANLPPGSTLADSEACRIDPILVTLAATYHGNLTISGASEAAQYQCITEVDGNLTVIGGGVSNSNNHHLANVSLALPNLQRVRGALTVDTDYVTTVSLPALTEVGTTLNLSINRFWSVPSLNAQNAQPLIGRLAAPALTKVGGDIELHTHRELGTAGYSVFDFGLDAVTSVGKNVLIDHPYLPGTPQGLGALLTVPGDLTIQQPMADVDDNQLLPLLQSVGGSLAVTTNPNFRNLLPALTTVSGDVAFTRNGSIGTLADKVTPLLAAVGGDVSIENYQTQPCSVLGSLTQVGGTFRIKGGKLTSYYGVSQPKAPQLGAVEIAGAEGNLIPFHAGATVNGAGPVSFINNFELCPCQVAAFSAVLAAAGWSGALTSIGNSGSPQCTLSCPQTTCP
jgi:hypothetical protein